MDWKYRGRGTWKRLGGSERAVKNRDLLRMGNSPDEAAQRVLEEIYLAHKKETFSTAQ